VRRVGTRLPALIAKGIQFVDGQARDAGVTIEVETSDDPVELDPDRVHQALRNLLENAIRHTPRDGIVRVSASRTGNIVRMVVSDSGPGFPPELLVGLFDPFTRANSDGSDPNGTGLGLAIVRAVAEAHGGSASAENTPDGARVTLSVQT
jgi:signal transduction histidine kinase